MSEIIYRVEDVDGDRRTWEIWYCVTEPRKTVGREVTVGRFIPDNTEPCEWEMSPAMMSSPKWITNCDMLKMQGFHFCPNCGRKLEEQ